jgi:hypothetical protein
MRKIVMRSPAMKSGKNDSWNFQPGGERFKEAFILRWSPVKQKLTQVQGNRTWNLPVGWRARTLNSLERFVVLKGHGFTGCGRTRSARGFVTGHEFTRAANAEK